MALVLTKVDGPLADFQRQTASLALLQLVPRMTTFLRSSRTSRKVNGVYGGSWNVFVSAKTAKHEGPSTRSASKRGINGRDTRPLLDAEPRCISSFVSLSAVFSFSFFSFLFLLLFVLHSCIRTLMHSIHRKRWHDARRRSRIIDAKSFHRCFVEKFAKFVFCALWSSLFGKRHPTWIRELFDF